MENYEDFKKFYLELSHINLDAYKEKQMKRRIETFIKRKGMDSFVQFTEALKSDKNELENFTDYITINVTEFFRTPEYWKFLEKKIIPQLKENLKYFNAEKKSGAGLKIWSAGCSTGEEPYSLAMLLLQYFSAGDFKILATDIDENVLKKAAGGIFSSKSMDTIPEEYSWLKEKYFEAVNEIPAEKKIINAFSHSENKFRTYRLPEIRYKIKAEVKNQIEFKKLDMTMEKFPFDCDLIVCRNVLIYFTEEIKQNIFRKFHESLKPGGTLFLGHTEQIVYYKNFCLEKLAKNFYRKN